MSAASLQIKWLTRTALYFIVFANIAFVISTITSPQEQEFLDAIGEGDDVGHHIGSRKAGKPPKVSGDPIVCTYQGQFGVAFECARFFICLRVGAKASYGYCPKNKLFHHRKRRCLKMSIDQCKESMCKQVGDKFPDPYSKERYLTCRRLSAELETCPEGKVYDHTAQDCVPGNPLEGLKSASEEDISVEIDKNKDPQSQNMGRSFMHAQMRGRDEAE